MGWKILRVKYARLASTFELALKLVTRQIVALQELESLKRKLIALHTKSKLLKCEKLI